MEDMKLTKYEINRQLYAKQSVLDPLQFSAAVAEIANDVINYHYLFLLNKERSDYTLFNITNKDLEKLKKELSVTIGNRGPLISAEKQPNGNWELWFKEFDNENDSVMYMLFDGEGFIVEV